MGHVRLPVSPGAYLSGQFLQPLSCCLSLGPWDLVPCVCTSGAGQDLKEVTKETLGLPLLGFPPS